MTIQIHRLLPRACPRLSRLSRTFTTTPALPKSAKPFPTTPTCPEPTCSCPPPPQLPDGFEIDRGTRLNGAIPSYSQHVLICTGQTNWKKHIELGNAGDNLAADLKELIGPGGKYSDPFHNISVLNSSFPPTPPPTKNADVIMDSVYILPMFKYVPYLPRVSFEHAEALVRAYLQPETLHPMYADLSPIHRDRLVRKPVYGNILYGVRDVEDVMVLICGHGSRDARCGLYGPLLKAEFERHLPVKGVEVVRGAVQVLKNEWKGQKELGGAVEEAMEDEGVKPKATARVGLISHIGGHKFAGNVVIYIPPGMKTKKGNPHPLAGHGIWYGRVQPSNVEGIVQETVVRGIVIEELFRGAIKQSGEIVTL